MAEPQKGRVITRQDWEKGAGSEEYAAYLLKARAKFQQGEAATVRELKNLFRRVAKDLREEIEGVTPGTLRAAHLNTLAKALEGSADTLNRQGLQAIQNGIEMAVREAVKGSEKITTDLTREIFDPVEIKWLFADINNRAVLAVLSRTRHDGLRVSDRIWRISQRARDSVRKIVEDGVTRGLNSRELARQVERYLQPDVWTPLKEETRRRLGVPKDISMEAMRLAVTELNNAFHEGTVLSYRAIPSARGIYWRLSHSHPQTDICDTYSRHNGDGFYGKGTEPTKPHPWCKCVTVPAMEDPKEFVKRLKQWRDNPQSQPDIENWYNSVARIFIRRPREKGNNPPRTSKFISELIRHGVKQQTAEAIERMSEELRQRTQDKDVEFAAMFGLEDGVQIGRILGGVLDAVDITEHIHQMQPGNHYVHMHTHPRSSSFSAADVSILVRFERLSVIVVTGKDGTRYIMSKSGNHVRNDQVVKSAYHNAIDALFSKYRQLVSDGMDQHIAWKEHSHEAWTNIASMLGLVYTRITE